MFHDYYHHYHSVLLKESENIQLLWLENDSVEGVDSTDAKNIVKSIRTSKNIKSIKTLENHKSLNLAVHKLKGELSNVLFTIEIGLNVNDLSFEKILDYLKSISVITDYNINSLCVDSLGKASFSFYLKNKMMVDGRYAAVSKINKDLIKILGLLPKDYAISFLESQVC